ncbi:YvrJ family protein [Vagococcus fluvialis]
MMDFLQFFEQDIFAIAVSIFLLVRVENKLDDLTKAITKLSTIIITNQKD